VNVLPQEPPPGLLMSMAIQFDHALGMDGYYDQPMFASSGMTHQQRLDQTLKEMSRIYEEVSGHGFYKWPPPPHPKERKEDE
jgi:hypothetical protein